MDGTFVLAIVGLSIVGVCVGLAVSLSAAYSIADIIYIVAIELIFVKRFFVSFPKALLAITNDEARVQCGSQSQHCFQMFRQWTLSAIYTHITCFLLIQMQMGGKGGKGTDGINRVSEVR